MNATKIFYIVCQAIIAVLTTISFAMGKSPLWSFLIILICAITVIVLSIIPSKDNKNE